MEASFREGGAQRGENEDDARVEAEVAAMVAS